MKVLETFLVFAITRSTETLAASSQLQYAPAPPRSLTIVGVSAQKNAFPKRTSSSR